MAKKHHKFKLAAIFVVLTLLLISLMSSPAAAVVNFNAGAGTSTNTNPPGPPTVVIFMAPPIVIPPPNITPLITTFSYTFMDLNAGPMGSNHICTLTVTQIVPPGPPAVVATSGWTFVPPGGVVAGVLTTNNPFGPAFPVVFSVTVSMTVIDLNVPMPPGRSATGGGMTTVTLL